MLQKNIHMIGLFKHVLIAGHMILNTVDCTRPNGGKLPQNVDLMLSDFAGGASGFPMTFFGGKYSGEAPLSGYEFHLTAHHSIVSIVWNFQTHHDLTPKQSF